MKRSVSLLIAALCSLFSMAQLSGNGYYRVQNTTTERYIHFVDNHGSIEKSGMTVVADCHALQTIRNFSNVESDPGSIIYIENNNSGYVLSSQGISSTDLTKGLTFSVSAVRGMTNAYKLGGTYQGVQVYLFDLNSASTIQYVNLKSDCMTWAFLPVAKSGSNYFGVTPEVEVDGKYYATLLAGFGFNAAASDVKVYVVEMVDYERGIAIYGELPGDVPMGTPVLVECAGASATNNRLELKSNASATIAANQLRGVYFCYAGDKDRDYEANQTPYLRTTQRVLGKTADGRLGFVKSNTLQYLPANKAFLPVQSSAPNELVLMSRTEYTLGIESAPVVERTQKGIYTLSGQRISDTSADRAKLPAGIYVIDGRKVAVGR